MSESFNKNEYTVHFDSVFTNKKMASGFKDFLASEHNVEPWNFLQDVLTLEGTSNGKDQLKKAKEIIKNYIAVGSKNEINISGDIRSEITENFKTQENSETWTIEMTPKQLFSNAFGVTINLLKHDPFKRFVRTAACEMVMKQFRHDSTVVSPAITRNFSYDDEFFTHPFFRDRDIDFFLSLFEDSYDWEVSKKMNLLKNFFFSQLIGSKISENTNAFFSSKNLLPDLTVVKDVKVSKLECFIPCTFDQALLSYFDNEQLYKSDPNCGKFETVDYYTHEQLLEVYKKNGVSEENGRYKRESSVNRLELKLPPPFNPRVADFGLTSYYDPENERFMKIGKNFMKEGSSWCESNVQEVTLKRGEKPQKKKCYSFFLFSAGMYTKIDENRVYYQEININDLAGWASTKTMFKVVNKDRKNKFRSQMLKLAMEYPGDVKIENQKEKLHSLVDGKTNGLGKLLYNTMELYKNVEEKKMEQTQKKEEIEYVEANNM